MKVTEQYSSVVLLITLYQVVLVNEILSVLSCTAVYYAVQVIVLTFESGDGIFVQSVTDHLNESSWAALFRGAVYYVVQDGSNFWVCG